MWNYNNAEFKEVNSSTHYKGKLGDRYSKGDLEICFQQNETCGNKGPDTCQQCKYGWYSIVDFNCPNGGSRICGQSNCGNRGEPACPRGKDFMELSRKSQCFLESKAGYCSPGLHTYCDQNNILICK